MLGLEGDFASALMAQQTTSPTCGQSLCEKRNYHWRSLCRERRHGQLPNPVCFENYAAYWPPSCAGSGSLYGSHFGKYVDSVFHFILWGNSFRCFLYIISFCNVFARYASSTPLFIFPGTQFWWYGQIARMKFFFCKKWSSSLHEWSSSFIFLKDNGTYLLISSLMPVLVIHCYAVLDLGSGVKQPIDALVQCCQLVYIYYKTCII